MNKPFKIMRFSELLCVSPVFFPSIIVSIFAMLFSTVLAAEGAVLEIEGATIRGNQELPTVLYVVPWQPAKVYSLDKPEQTLASSRPLQMLERASFQRTLKYHKLFMTSELSKPSEIDKAAKSE